MLGTEAAETMVQWLDELEADHDSLGRELRTEMTAVRAEIGAVRTEMTALRAEIRGEMTAGFAAVDVKLAALREEMRVGFAAVGERIEQRNASLMKWMIGFWIGSFVGIVGAILAVSRIRP